ncbi:protein angel isoform X2 [Lycorma delicatula]|uniref:protein angel isoform X2 n=1 Tax=Lycorma delicatula TaxID=130591 RepID=UPI003F50EB6A
MIIVFNKCEKTLLLSSMTFFLLCILLAFIFKLSYFQELPDDYNLTQADKKNQNDFKLEEDCTMLDASVINKSEEKSNSNEVTDEENTSINAINKNISELNLENAFVNKSNISDNSGCELHSNSSDLMKQHDNHNNLKSRSAKKHLKKEKLEDEKFEEIRQYEYTLQGCGFIKEPYDAKEKQVRFTIISYNVLSQALLEDNMRLYRDHDPMYLNWAYRSTLLMKELTKIGADIMCLQEVEDRHKLMFFDQFLQKGYQGIYKKRTGDKGDGCAIYYKTEKFVLVDYATVEYYQPNIDVLNRDNIAIVAKFHPVGFPNNPIVVATTHLLYNPRRHDIKLAQTQILLAEIERFAFKNPNSKFKYHPVILTGDFNLEPYSSVYELILLGKLNYEKLDRKMLKSTVDQGVCSYPPYGLPMGKYLLPPSLGVTDNCMHYGLNELRLNSATVKSSVQDYLIGLYNSDRHNVPKDFPQCEKMSDLFSTGTLYNRNFDFYTVHFHEDNKSMSEATTKHHEWITVDYMFFTPLTDPTYRHNQLQLISRKRLPTVFECEHYLRNIPNRLCPSDHLPIVATFFLRIPSKCV